MKKKYLPSLIFSLSLHALVIGLSIWGISFKNEKKYINIGKNLISAKIITINQKQQNNNKKNPLKIQKKLNDKKIDHDKKITITKENNIKNEYIEKKQENLPKIEEKKQKKEIEKKVKNEKNKIPQKKKEKDNKKQIKKKSIFSEIKNDKKENKTNVTKETKKKEVIKNEKNNKKIIKNDLSKLLEEIDKNRIEIQEDIENISQSGGEIDHELAKEIAEISEKIHNSWNWAGFEGGISDKSQMRAIIYIKLDINANIIKAEVTESHGTGSAQDEKAFIYSALAAVHNAAPFTNLPKDKYQDWKEIEVNFCPSC